MTSNQRLDSRSDREAYDRNGPSAQRANNGSPKPTTSVRGIQENTRERQRRIRKAHPRSRLENMA